MRLKMLGMAGFYTIARMAGSAATPTVDLAALTPDALLDALLPAPARAALVARVLAEDLGDAGDVTSEAMVDADARARAVLRPRSAGIASPRSVGPTSQSSTTICATSPTKPIAASK